MNFSLGSQILTGPGIRSVVSGGPAPTISDPFTVFRNPAGLRYVWDRPYVGITFHPPISVNMADLADVQTSVNEQIDGVTEDYSRSGRFVYPEFEGTLGQLSSSMSSFAFTTGKYPWQFGLGYSRVYRYSAEFSVIGLRERVDSVPADPAGQSVAMAIQTNLGLKLDIAADSWAFAAARDYGENLSLGASMTRTTLSFEMRGGYRVDGLMESSGQISTFNDPNDPWYNNLSSDSKGGYEGSSYALNIGAVYVPWDEDEWRFGADLKLVTRAAMDGDLLLAIDEFPALKLKTTGEEKAFDVNRIDDVSELTKTYRNTYQTPGTMYFDLPSSIELGVSRASGFRPNLSFKYYFGKFGYEMELREKRVFDADYTTTTYARGIDPLAEAYIGIHPGWFFAGFGIIWSQDYSIGYRDSNGVPIKDGTILNIPRFDLGFTGHLTENLRYEVLVDGLPEDFMRLGLTYAF